MALGIASSLGFDMGAAADRISNAIADPSSVVAGASNATAAAVNVAGQVTASSICLGCGGLASRPAHGSGDYGSGTNPVGLPPAICPTDNCPD